MEIRPPGTGKTLLARSVTASTSASFLSVSMSSIQSMWVGENEKNVKVEFFYFFNRKEISLI